MNSNFGSVINDLLYGPIELASREVALLQTPEVSRLAHVEMSPPTAFFSDRKCASRLKHSLGVAHLCALLVQLCPGLRKLGRNPFLAGLIHDLKSPPFSHASEAALRLVMKINHEEWVLLLLDQPHSRLCRAIKSCGGNLEVIKKLLRGPLFRGAPDLDNLDNSLRWGIALGCPVVHYDPRAIVADYRWIDDELYLHPQAVNNLELWSACRRSVYNHVYSTAVNGTFVMVERLECLMARDGRLSFDFFDLTDVGAITYIRRHGDRGIVEMLDRLLKKDHCVLATRQEFTQTIASRVDCQDLADTIARELKLPPTAISIGLNRREGSKKRSVPLVGEDSNRCAIPIDDQPKTWDVHAYLARGYEQCAADVREIVNHEYNQLVYAPAKAS